MPTRFKKTRNKRGDRKMGYGRVGNHHKHPSGRGMAGSKHHHKTWVNRFHPGYFGKNGMRQYHLLRNREWAPAINVNEIWKLVPEDVRETVIKHNEKAKSSNNPNDIKAPLIDVVEHGYAKVIGKGRLPLSQPVVVRARFFSKRAEEKIVLSGGRCLLRA
ncbi:60S ribosomal protein L28 [Reticulomyxa filosa]|uniref:60S ribosomal protein L28 n=1 Tax=Reticulomyxa filosa TaxID=46433 RepID=X6MYF2_RETFI|nr:60S ribosomal protein L28 [Reticulomyxa filosa]|eukprot:ETO18105.1 60S ribosomal protein L28 [Reticulomyxa filosa]